MNKVELGFSQAPFLLPKNVIRDPTLDPKKNIVSAETATYGLLIESCEMFEPRKGADMLKIMVRVLGADGPSTGSCCYMLQTDSEYFQRDAARFMCNLMNVPPTALAESDYDRLVSAEQPARGRVILAQVDNVKNTKTNIGNDFTRIEWSPGVPVLDAAGALVGVKPADHNALQEFLNAQKFAA